MDYLFHEWAGKPALIVSYGSRGGSKAAVQLIEVCKGLRMKPLESSVGYLINPGENETARENGDFDAQRKDIWKTEGVDAALGTRFQELIALL